MEDHELATSSSSLSSSKRRTADFLSDSLALGHGSRGSLGRPQRELNKAQLLLNRVAQVTVILHAVPAKIAAVATTAAAAAKYQYKKYHFIMLSTGCEGLLNNILFFFCSGKQGSQGVGGERACDPLGNLVDCGGVQLLPDHRHRVPHHRAPNHTQGEQGRHHHHRANNTNW